MKKKYPGWNRYEKIAYYERTGEFRAPKKGEYYLSGAIPEAYRAPNDLSMEFHILREINPPAQTITVDGFQYRLNGVAL
jgi:hypothetical protein